MPHSRNSNNNNIKLIGSKETIWVQRKCGASEFRETSTIQVYYIEMILQVVNVHKISGNSLPFFFVDEYQQQIPRNDKIKIGVWLNSVKRSSSSMLTLSLFIFFSGSCCLFYVCCRQCCRPKSRQNFAKQIYGYVHVHPIMTIRKEFFVFFLCGFA